MKRLSRVAYNPALVAAVPRHHEVSSGKSRLWAAEGAPLREGRSAMDGARVALNTDVAPRRPAAEQVNEGSKSSERSEGRCRESTAQVLGTSGVRIVAKWHE